MSGAGDIKLTKDGNVLLHEMVSVAVTDCCNMKECYSYVLLSLERKQQVARKYGGEFRN